LGLLAGHVGMLLRTTCCSIIGLGSNVDSYYHPYLASLGWLGGGRGGLDSTLPVITTTITMALSDDTTTNNPIMAEQQQQQQHQHQHQQSSYLATTKRRNSRAIVLLQRRPAMTLCPYLE
jgi:hypothetical protein